jgi:hypothetical protein
VEAELSYRSMKSNRDNFTLTTRIDTVREITFRHFALMMYVHTKK